MKEINKREAMAQPKSGGQVSPLFQRYLIHIIGYLLVVCQYFRKFTHRNMCYFYARRLKTTRRHRVNN